MKGISKYATVAILISLVALGVSIRSCSLAGRATKHQKRSFIAEHRPYLNMELIKYKDTEDYLHVVRDPDGIILEVTFEMVNEGSVPARDIHVPKSVRFIGVKEITPFVPELPADFALGPGQREKLRAVTIIESVSGSEKNLETWFEEFSSGQRSVTMKMVLIYGSELEPDREYKTRVAYRIQKDNAWLIGREME